MAASNSSVENRRGVATVASDHPDLFFCSWSKQERAGCQQICCQLRPGLAGCQADDRAEPDDDPAAYFHAPITIM